MNYIDLENGIYTDPETLKTYKCKIDENRWFGKGVTQYFLYIDGKDNDAPLQALGFVNCDDCINCSARKTYLQTNGFNCATWDSRFPEFYTKDGAIALCDFINRKLNEKYGHKSSAAQDAGSESITLNFE